jgi:3',5'-cyclic AMP phosphodiesterase CpdA
MIRIAHLSDIHFGNPFNVATWDAVAHEVVKFEPDLIVVSGDLVDQPSPAYLLAAKCALRDLSRKAREGSEQRHEAELVVVPGNHDLFEWGTSATQSRHHWFERIFGQVDTGQAEDSLAAQIGCSLGFNETCRKLPAIRRTLNARVRSFFGLSPTDFTRHLPLDPVPIPRVITPEESPVLLALLDSNPSGGWIDLATGLVDDQQLASLRRELDAAANPYVARIAVVHHHVLPVASAEGPRARREPAMVLRNAGAVLRVLADQRFDLILHGHWHKPQVARLNLGTEDGEGYPITVAAAGSAAWDTDEPTGNCFNLVTVENNGRILVKSVYYGPGQPRPSSSVAPCVHSPRQASWAF